MNTAAQIMRGLLEAVEDRDSLYVRDETSWREREMALLANGEVSKIDHKNLAVYLAEMTRSEQNALESRMERLLQHLLKINMQPEKRTSSWNQTVLEQQRRITRTLERSPGLKKYVPELWEAAYPAAIRYAAAETSIPVANFPISNPWTLESALAFDPLQE